MPDKINLPDPTSAAELVEQIATGYTVIAPEDLEGLGIMRALAAETATAVLALPESKSLDEMTGEPFWLDGIDFFTYSAVKGREDDLYVYLSCHYDNGQGFQATTGSGYTIGRVHRLVQLGVLPRRVMSVLVESKRNQGQSSLWVIDAPERPTNGAREVVTVTSREELATFVDGPEPF